MAGVRAQIAYRFTFIDEEDDNRRDGAGRVQARSLSPLRTSVANSEALVVDAWAQRHLRTLRQGQDATVFDAQRCAAARSSTLQSKGDARMVTPVVFAITTPLPQNLTTSA